MLQDDAIESVDDTQVEDSQEVAESQEVAPKNDDFVEFNDQQQKKFNKVVWEKNEAIRKAKALEEKLNTHIMYRKNLKLAKELRAKINKHLEAKE